MRWPLLRELSEEDRADLFVRAKRRRYEPGQVIVSVGEVGDAMHLLAEGYVAVRMPTSDGARVLVRVLTAGDVVGEMALLASAPRMADATALSDVETLRISASFLAELRVAYPSIDRMLLVSAVEEIARLSSLLAEALHAPPRERLGQTLLDLAERGRALGEESFSVPLSDQDLADLVGADEAVVTGLVGELEGAAIARRAADGLELLDVAALRRAMTPSG
jgi:CRP/FNR family transcriptional regulator